MTPGRRAGRRRRDFAGRRATAGAGHATTAVGPPSRPTAGARR